MPERLTTLVLDGKTTTDEDEAFGLLIEIRTSRGPEYVKQTLGDMEITPELVVPVPEDQLLRGSFTLVEEDGTEEVHPLYTTPDMQLFFRTSPNSTTSMAEHCSIQGTDVILRVVAPNMEYFPQGSDELINDKKKFVAECLNRFLKIGFAQIGI